MPWPLAHNGLEIRKKYNSSKKSAYYLGHTRSQHYLSFNCGQWSLWGYNLVSNFYRNYLHFALFFPFLACCVFRESGWWDQSGSKISDEFLVELW